MKEFFSFIKSGKTGNKKDYFQDFVVLFSLVFLIGISISLLKHYFYSISLIDDDSFKMLNWKTFISFVLVVPLFEEIIFRAPLLIPKAKIYSILICIVSIVGSLVFIKNENITLIIIIILISLQVLYLMNERMRIAINKIIKDRYLILVIISSISFGLIHMGNYQTINSITFISVIGRIIAGFYFAFIVTKYDFKSSYLLHGINNIIPFIILLIAK